MLPSCSQKLVDVEKPLLQFRATITTGSCCPPHRLALAPCLRSVAGPSSSQVPRVTLDESVTGLPEGCVIEARAVVDWRVRSSQYR